MEKIAVAMSGGVDSAAAALLVRQSGAETVGFTMAHLGPAESSAEVRDAAAVCSFLGISHFAVDCRKEFRQAVVLPFCEAYRAGVTPNPCVFCNPAIKFGVLLDRVLSAGFEKMATGHYARVAFDGGRWKVFKAQDPKKDQSYMLWGLSQSALSHALFPLGEMTKEEIRALAVSAGIPVAKKPESQDICFVPDGDYASFLEREAGFTAVPGNYVDESGAVLGSHKGIIHYTVGQHKRLGLGTHEIRYVLRLDAAQNRIVLGPEDSLFSREAVARSVNFVSADPSFFSSPVPVLAKARYRAPERPAVASFDGERLTVKFDTPQRAITPGQSLVLYAPDGSLLCGGIIV